MVPAIRRRGFLFAGGTSVLSALPHAHGQTPAQATQKFFTLGVQYYRAPFPEERFWVEDLKRMKDSGLDTVQLWVLWSWVEAVPNRMNFDDYDRLVELAEKAGLDVVISTIAELHPHWIHRVVPGSEMRDHLGNTVISSNRSEANFGLTPGGCSDHPGVQARMRKFIAAVINRYKNLPGLRAWDIWNETRWNVQADGLVCFCPHTLAAFRKNLQATFGDLGKLNAAWKRRYQTWEEVEPGKLPRRPFTEMMAWQRFITERANQHAAWRFKLIKGLDPKHPATLHGPSPCVHHQGNIAHPSYPLERGNDWDFADAVDGVGSSVFPTWWGMDDAAFAVLATAVKSAARDKRAWLSEVQGGRAAQGVDPQEPVTAAAQQRWLWTAIACGIDTVLFWCWRDEVFGGESAGYGLVGRDGHAQQRLSALRATRKLLNKHEPWLSRYKPSKPQVGVLFSPESYRLLWSQSGAGYPVRYALESYARALTKASLPYVVVEENHAQALEGLKVVYLPRVTCTSDALDEALAKFVENGGTLVCESECGAFTPEGFYREPPDRMLARRLGIQEVGRRTPQKPRVELHLRGRALSIPSAGWTTPAHTDHAEIFTPHDEGALVLSRVVGKGRVIYVGTYFGDAYRETFNVDFEHFVADVAAMAGVQPSVEVLNTPATASIGAFVKTGEADGKMVAFVLAEPGAKQVSVRLRGPARGEGLRELLRDVALEPQRSGTETIVKVPLNEWGLAIIMG